MQKGVLKAKSYQLEAGSPGFTLIELLVVLGIMVILTGIFLISFNRLQGPRNLRIAQNQLVTDIRRIQSYTLSSRNVSSSGNPARYYIMKFETANPNSYVVQAIDNQNTPFTIETIALPQTVQFSSLSIQPPTGSAVSATCVQVAFSLPFGRIFTEYKTSSSQNCDIASTFLNSGDLSANKNLILRATLLDTTSGGTLQKIVEVNGISQAIEAK